VRIRASAFLFCYTNTMRLWVLKRRLAGFLVLLGMFIIIGGSLAYIFWPRPSCVDGVQNGDEKGVDCGGSCSKQCLGEIPVSPKRLWQRFFQVRPGVYDVGAMIENVNLFVGTKVFRYTVKLYSEENVLLAERQGTTFLLPNQKALIFEPNMVPGPRAPARVDFSFEEPITWTRMDAGDAQKIEVISRRFESDPHPIVRVKLRNKSTSRESELEISLVLESKDGNAFAVARTTLEDFVAGSEREAVFSWPTSQFQEPASMQVLYRRVVR